VLRVPTVVALPRGLDADCVNCDYCGEALGAYEPLVWLRPDGDDLLGSLLSITGHPEWSAGAGTVVHGACGELLTNPRAATEDLSAASDFNGDTPREDERSPAQSTHPVRPPGIRPLTRG
jgi:hypothetical protein